MADLRARSAERLRRRTPSPENSRRSLKEALRSGSLELWQIDLLSYCSYTPAVELLLEMGVLGTESPAELEFGDPSPIALWIEGLLEFKREDLLAIAALEIARFTSAVFSETCCCGSDLRSHSWAGDNHNFVHACEYYGVDCQCRSPVADELIEIIELFIGAPRAEQSKLQERWRLAWIEADRHLCSFLPSPGFLDDLGCRLETFRDLERAGAGMSFLQALKLSIVRRVLGQHTD